MVLLKIGDEFDLKRPHGKQYHCRVIGFSRSRGADRVIIKRWIGTRNEWSKFSLLVKLEKVTKQLSQDSSHDRQ